MNDTAPVVECFGYPSRHAYVEIWTSRRFVTEVIALEQGRKNARFFVSRLALANAHALGFLEANAYA